MLTHNAIFSPSTSASFGFVVSIRIIIIIIMMNRNLFNYLRSKRKENKNLNFSYLFMQFRFNKFENALSECVCFFLMQICYNKMAKWEAFDALKNFFREMSKKNMEILIVFFPFLHFIFIKFLIHGILLCSEFSLSFFLFYQ